MKALKSFLARWCKKSDLEHIRNILLGAFILLLIYTIKVGLSMPENPCDTAPSPLACEVQHHLNQESQQ